jgi:ArsR family transcriptional regulator
LTYPPLPSPTSDLPRDEVAQLFGLAANPIRLLTLACLRNGPRSVEQIAESLGRDRRLITQCLNALVGAHAVRFTREGRHRLYAPTDAGRRLIRAAGILSGNTSAAGSGSGSCDRTSPNNQPGRVDTLSHGVSLLRALAEPVRLRLLNLLAGRQEVCVCHLHEALDLPQSTVSRHLTILKQTGLIVGRRHGTWVYYRLAVSAPDLEDLVAGCFQRGLLQSGILTDDRRRLEGLIPCADRPGPVR